MTVEEFCSLPECPSVYPDELRAMWFAAQDDWETAHELVQDVSSAQAAWIHAYLHRWEGDTSNARYWYHRANKPICNEALDIERKKITQSLMKYYSV